LIAIHSWIESYGYFETSLKPGTTTPHHHRDSVPHPLRGKGHRKLQ
jgi:hypothetical protein